MAWRRRGRGRRSLLSVSGAEELQAAVLAMKAADKTLRKDLNSRTKEMLGTEWTQALGAHITGVNDRVIMAGARVAAGNPPQLIAGNSKRVLGRGLVPVEHWAAFEYGSSRRDKSEHYMRTSPKGTKHTVKRRTAAQLRARSKTGYVIGPAVSEILPRLAALWVQTIIRTYLDAAEGK